METLQQLFEETLKDIYFAEKQIIKSLPKMAKKTKTPQLKAAFEEHLEQTKGQVERLDEIFKLMGKKASGKQCAALLGLVQEAEELMSEASDPEVLDAGLIGCAQAVEHYEIARYGTLRAWAEQLKMPQAAKLIDATLKEEKSHRREAEQARHERRQLRRQAGGHANRQPIVRQAETGQGARAQHTGQDCREAEEHRDQERRCQHQERTGQDHQRDPQAGKQADAAEEIVSAARGEQTTLPGVSQPYRQGRCIGAALPVVAVFPCASLKREQPILRPIPE